MEELLQYLDSISSLSEELRDCIINNLKVKTLPRKGVLLREGQACNCLYYIEKGLLRSYYKKGSEEISSWFMLERDIVISVESFFTNQPSQETIHALEDCLLYYMDREELRKMYLQFPELNFIGRVITEKYYVLSQQRLKALRLQRAVDKYNHLLHQFPQLIKRVPSTYLATYLGITLETLSRIKGKM